MNRLQALKEKIDDRKAEYRTSRRKVKDLMSDIKRLKKEVIDKEKALELVKAVALETQSQLEFHLSDMVTAGLNTVFDEPYEFVVKFEIKRGKTECGLWFKKGEEFVDPLRFSGLGASDVAAFCLRCAAWSMDKRFRNTLILDEPFKHLKGETENVRAIQLMQTLSRKLNLQIICVNDERAPREDILQYSDRTFDVTQINGISKIKEVG